MTGARQRGPTGRHRGITGEIAPQQALSTVHGLRPLPALVTPSHGGGQIYRGGVIGHRGGRGRPPDAIRKALRAAGWTAIGKVLMPLIEGHTTTVVTPSGEVVEVGPTWSDRLRAVEIALKYGLGTPDRVTASGAASADTYQPVILIDV